MKTKYIIITLFFITIFIGCSDDFMDTKQKGVTDIENFYKTDAEALQGVTSIYDRFQYMCNTYGGYKQTLDILSDDAYTGGSLRGDFFLAEEFDEFRYGSNNMILNWNFQWLYEGVYRSNVVLKYTTNDSAKKKVIIAEAKALRAMFYFELVTGWGDVPLVTAPLAPSEYAQPRAPKAEVWAQIEKDLTEAAADLPLKSQQGAGEKQRVSKGTALSMLGKAYLFQKKYTEAAAEFQKVIDSKEYSLYPDFSKITQVDSEFGVESIFEVSQPNNSANISAGETSMNGLFWQPKGGGWFQPTFQPGGQLNIVNFGFNIMTAKLSLWQAFADAGDVVRRNGTVLSEAEVIARGSKLRNLEQATPSLPQGTLAYSTDACLRVKYASWATESSTGWMNYVENYGTNTRWIRYADVLLMAAEAYNRKSTPDDSKALLCINQVRERAQIPALTVTGDALFTAIKLERRLELAFENHRFQDLIRWGDAAKVLADEGKLIPKGDGTYISVENAGFKEKNWLFPLPDSELSTNPNITGNNPGY